MAHRFNPGPADGPPRRRRKGSSFGAAVPLFGSQGASINVSAADVVVPPSDESELEEYASDASSAESEMDFAMRVRASAVAPALDKGKGKVRAAPASAEAQASAGNPSAPALSLAPVPAPAVARMEDYAVLELSPSPEPGDEPMDASESPFLPLTDEEAYQLGAIASTIEAELTGVSAPVSLSGAGHNAAIPTDGLRDLEGEQDAVFIPAEAALVQESSAPEAAMPTDGIEVVAHQPQAEEAAQVSVAEPERETGLAQTQTQAAGPAEEVPIAAEPPRKKRKRASNKAAVEPATSVLAGPPRDYIAQAWAVRSSTLRAFWASFAFDAEDEVITRRKYHADIRESSRRYIDLDIMAADGLKFEEDYNVEQKREGADLGWLRQSDHQDHLLSAAVSRAAELRARHKARNAALAKIAKMVKLYWVHKAQAEEKAKRAEERRLKKLAKWTGKEVMKQWHLAIDLVGRQKEEARRKEHEREGRKQLNAILEQSTQMLHVQRSELYADGSMASLMDIDSDSEDGQADESDAEEDDEDTSDDEGSSEEGDDTESDADADADRSDEELDAIPEAIMHRPAAITPPAETPKAPLIAVVADEAALIDDSGDSLIDDSGASLTGSFSGASSSSDDDSDSESDTSSAHTTPVEPGGAGGGESSKDTLEADPKKWWARFLVADEVEQPVGSKPGITEMDDEDGAFDPPPEELANRNTSGSPILAHEALEAESPSTHADSSPVSQRSTPSRSIKPSSATNSLHDTLLKKKKPTKKDRISRRSASRSSSVLSGAKASQAGARESETPGPDQPKVRVPFLLRGVLRPYQHVGLDWLASLYSNGVNGILADEMGLGKTIQTIALLAHLACDYGNWGPHLVVAPTSVMLNWEVEFKKFLPGFKILTYYGTQKERKEKRIGWSGENAFNVCITSYQLTLADAHILRRRSWQYLILDEAHHIKNFRSQRWQTLLGFNSQRRLLLTGTPLQNNLLDLWSLMYFLMPHGLSQSMEGYGAFASLKDFQDWFSKPIDKAIEAGGPMGEETKEMITKLHTVLRPYLLRRLKKDVEKELPSKYEHVITCRLSKRQRFLYNDFMSRAKTKESLASGSYLSIINCLMQLRKVCNHPDLFEERPIVTSFAMDRPVAAAFEIQELLIRRRMMQDESLQQVDLSVLNGDLTAHEHLTPIVTRSIKKLDATTKMPYYRAEIPPPLPMDTWSIDVFPKVQARAKLIKTMHRWKHFATLNARRCSRQPIYGSALIEKLQSCTRTILPLEVVEQDRSRYLKRSDSLHAIVQSYAARKRGLDSTLDRFAVVTPAVTTHDLARLAIPEVSAAAPPELQSVEFDTLHSVATKLHIAFPDASLLQYDCGKLQQLDVLMRRLKQGGHRILIFTQMTKMLNILESFLNYHGYRYLRLDGATKVDQRQLLTERFNRDARIDAFILSTRSGGLGINLVGADTVLFYDLDWNAAIEAQCMDRAHRIGQTRDVHIYRFVSEHTVEENMLRKANQKRALDSVVIQEGEFNTETLVRNDWRDMFDEGGRTIAGVPVGRGADQLGAEADRHLKAVEDEEDVAAAVVAEEEGDLDRNDYAVMDEPAAEDGEAVGDGHGGDEDEEASIDNYMISFVRDGWDEYFEDYFGG